LRAEGWEAQPPHCVGCLGWNHVKNAAEITCIEDHAVPGGPIDGLLEFVTRQCAGIAGLTGGYRGRHLVAKKMDEFHKLIQRKQ
jgi:hypothetical protein